MELKAIRLFVVLADELHFGKAAKRAGVTQSVLSVQIKRLEDLLGASLFSRSTREVSLTEVGRTFRDEATGILRRVDEAVRAAQATAAGSGRLLRIGITSAVEVSDLTDRIAAFRAERPDVQVLIRELGTIEQEAALASGGINIGILHPPVDQADLQLTSLRDDRFYAVYHSDFFQLAQPLDWSELLASPLVFYPRRRAPRLFDGFVGFAHGLGVTANIVAEAETFFAAMAMAQAGLGIAFLPEPLLHLQRGLSVQPLPDDAPIRLQTALAVHQSMGGDALVQAAVQQLSAT